jgi:hypothetical protein
MKRAIQVGHYLTRTSLVLGSEVSASNDAKIERRMLQVLSERGRIPKRELQQAMSGRLSSERFNRHLTGLTQVGWIKCEGSYVETIPGVNPDMLVSADRVGNVDSIDTLTELFDEDEPMNQLPIVNDFNVSTRQRVNTPAEERF